MTNRLDSYLSAYGKGFGFEFDNNIMLNWYPERIMRLCKSTDRLLELGIGHGYTTQRFSSFFSQHVVVDGSASVIEQFQLQYPDCRAEIVESYFENFEPGQQFDVIVLGFILEHVSDPKAILERFKQFLAPGGRCFVSVPNGESLHRRFGHAAGLLENMMALGEGDLALGHERVYSVSSLLSLLVDCGYDVVRKEGIFLKPMTTNQLLSLELDPEIIRAMCEVGVTYPELSCGLLFEAKVDTP